MFLNPTWLKKPSIFISSTMEDLNNIYRQQIIKSLKEMGFELLDFQDSNFPHSLNPSAEVIKDSLKAVKSAEIFILILGKRYGKIFKEGKSIIHHEYNEAINNNIPILIFINNDVWRDFSYGRQDSENIENKKHFQFIKEISIHKIYPFQEYEDCISHMKNIFNNFFGGFLYFSKLADWLWDKDKTIEVECNSSEIWIITPDFYYDCIEPEKFKEVTCNIIDRNCKYKYIYRLTEENKNRIKELKRIYKLCLEEKRQNTNILDKLIMYLPVPPDEFFWATEQIIFNPFQLNESAIMVDIMESKDKTTRFNIEMGREKRIEFRSSFINYWNNNIQDENNKIKYSIEEVR